VANVYAESLVKNNHKIVKGRHHLCSKNTTDMCCTRIMHRSGNQFCKEKFRR